MTEMGFREYLRDSCRRIMKHYGTKKQKIQAVQELSELICILTRRDDQIKADALYTDKVEDELADCIIMIEQMRQAHQILLADLQERIQAKIARQNMRIEAELESEGDEV